MKVEYLDLADSRKGDRSDSQAPPGPTPREVLQELFQLLEDYAPTWYTEEHHNRAVATLLAMEAKDGPH